MLQLARETPFFFYSIPFFMLLSDTLRGERQPLHVHTHAHVDRHTHTRMLIHVSQSSWHFPWKKWGHQRCIWNMFWLLWLWQSVFPERQRAPWHRCPVIDGTMSRLWKIHWRLQRDCTVSGFDWEERQESFHLGWLQWHVLRCLFSRVLRLTEHDEA